MSDVIRKMIEDRRKQAENCRAMLKLLQPEFDKFEAKPPVEPYNIYVVRDYVDHKNALRKHEEEIAALEAVKAPLSTDRIEYLKVCKDSEQYGYTLTKDEEADWIEYVATQHKTSKLVEALRECADKLNVLVVCGRYHDDAERKCAERAIAMATEALRG